jgi:hypothetical protein
MTETVTVPVPDVGADAEAARAAHSAQVASEAAAQALVMTEVTAAKVEQDAANELAEYQERLSEWQAQNEALKADFYQHRDEMKAWQTQAMEAIGRLTPPEPPPTPDNPQSLTAGEQSAGAPQAVEVPPPPTEPSPPRKKAHRWI